MMIRQTKVHSYGAILAAVLAAAPCFSAPVLAQAPEHGPVAANLAPIVTGQGGVSVCLTSQQDEQATSLLVVPSGTVFEASTGPGGHTAQAFVTTETVTLTKAQPCGIADASTVVSHTRHWLVNPVKPQADTQFHPVGDVSGNGVDTSFGDEDETLRHAISSGHLLARVQGRLHDTVFLTESDADIEDPDAPAKP
ncbi:hypothetical protein [Acetobacter cibinongensis]|uniref:hypothetical protein n=1 Tax=Acetobacter cibinongensis TaxID=146475 RepID=UPI000A37F2C6|nr:hypothetical protein [Acetobacter cibinongensis]